MDMITGRVPLSLSLGQLRGMFLGKPTRSRNRRRRLSLADGAGAPTAIDGAVAFSKLWNVPALMTEFGDCSAKVPAQDNGIGWSFCEYSCYCDTRPSKACLPGGSCDFGACITGTNGNANLNLTCNQTTGRHPPILPRRRHQSLPPPSPPSPPHAPLPPPPAATPELYFLLMNQNPNTAYDVDAVTTLFKRAKTAGYTGTILYDHSLEALRSPSLSADYLASLKTVMAAADAHDIELVPQIYSYGDSAGMVVYDINLTEPTPAHRVFVVSEGGTRLETDQSSAPALHNGDFSQHTGNTTAGWAEPGQAAGVRTFIDGTAIPRAPGAVGPWSLRVEARGRGMARLVQNFAIPWSNATGSVTASFWVRGEGLNFAAEDPDIRLQLNYDGMDSCNRWEPSIRSATVHGKPSAFCRDSTTASNCSLGWIRATVDCPMTTASHTDGAGTLELWLGLWGNGTAGRTWFSDCALSVGGSTISNVLRRDGAPFTLSAPRLPGVSLVEGIDYEPVAATPQSAVDPRGFFPAHAATQNITLPAKTTRLRPGDSVTASFFAVTPGQPEACLASDASDFYFVIDEIIATSWRAPRSTRRSSGWGRRTWYGTTKSHSCTRATPAGQRLRPPASSSRGMPTTRPMCCTERRPEAGAGLERYVRPLSQRQPDRCRPQVSLPAPDRGRGHRGVGGALPRLGCCQLAAQQPWRQLDVGGVRPEGSVPDAVAPVVRVPRVLAVYLRVLRQRERHRERGRRDPKRPRGSGAPLHDLWRVGALGARGSQDWGRRLLPARVLRRREQGEVARTFGRGQNAAARLQVVAHRRNPVPVLSRACRRTLGRGILLRRDTPKYPPPHHMKPIKNMSMYRAR